SWMPQVAKKVELQVAGICSRKLRQQGSLALVEDFACGLRLCRLRCRSLARHVIIGNGWRFRLRRFRPNLFRLYVNSLVRRSWFLFLLYAQARICLGHFVRFPLSLFARSDVDRLIIHVLKLLLGVHRCTAKVGKQRTKYHSLHARFAHLPGVLWPGAPVFRPKSSSLSVFNGELCP